MHIIFALHDCVLSTLASTVIKLNHSVIVFPGKLLSGKSRSSPASKNSCIRHWFLTEVGDATDVTFCRRGEGGG